MKANFFKKLHFHSEVAGQQMVRIVLSPSWDEILKKVPGFKLVYSFPSLDLNNICKYQILGIELLSFSDNKP